MELKLQKVVSVLTLLTAWAYSLGWLKMSFYFATFGVGLSSLKIPVQDYLFESWYVVENVFFFLLLLWIAAISRHWLVWLITAAYSFIPYLTQAAFLRHHWRIASWLTEHDHSILKFTPFVVLLLVMLIRKQEFQRLKNLSWPYTRSSFAVFVLVVFAWSISAAKHFGASDADRVLLSPPKYLSHVKLHVSSSAPELKPLESRPNLYMLYASPDDYFVWDTTDFLFGVPGRQVTLLGAPRDKIVSVDAWKEPEIKPGALIF